MQFQIFVALAAGLVLPIQALINGRLAAGVGGAFVASNISFLVAAVVLLLVQLVLGKPLPSLAQLASVPALYWIGGALGAVYVTGAITSVSALGPTAAICLIIAGQILGALTVDYFGILAATAKSMSILRILGALLVMAGAVLVVTS